VLQISPVENFFTNIKSNSPPFSRQHFDIQGNYFLFLLIIGNIDSQREIKETKFQLFITVNRKAFVLLNT